MFCVPRANPFKSIFTMYHPSSIALGVLFLALVCFLAAASTHRQGCAPRDAIFIVAVGVIVAIGGVVLLVLAPDIAL